jgi:tRNA 2-thiouridine synthesizing protein A
MSVSIITDQVLDCRGLACPMPILKTRRALEAMQVGQVLKMTATDPGSVNDIEAFTRKTGYYLMETERVDGTYVFYIQKNK